MGASRLWRALLACVLLTTGLIASASAEGKGPGGAYRAALSGGEEVPPRATPAAGEAAFQLSDDGLALAYTVTVRNIANVTAGHIHLAPRGQNGDVVLPLLPAAPPGGGPASGIIAQGTATAADLTGPLQGQPLAALVAALDAGEAYVNIHTASGTSPATQLPGDLPPGEIRGQIAPVPATMPRSGGGFATRERWLPLGPVLATIAAIGGIAVVHARGRRT